MLAVPARRLGDVTRVLDCIWENGLLLSPLEVIRGSSISQTTTVSQGKG